MPRQIGKLSAVHLRSNDPGLRSDGGGLYLRVAANGGKFWVFRFMLHGKAREMGLGALHALSLADARIKAADCRKMLTDGIDPIVARDAHAAKKQLEAARAKTFKQCAEAYIDAHKAAWRNEKHTWQWENTLERFVYPIFGDTSVQDIDVALVTKALEPIWTTKTETATRVRGRIEVILDWATAREYRRGENPARWRGHLENLLARPSKLQKVKHHPALPYDQIGDFMEALKLQEGEAPLALAFAILTATRTGEVIKATWKEFDLKKKIWTIPANHTKAGREHRIPLSETTIRILKEIQNCQELIGQKKETGDSWVFIGKKLGRPLSNMAMLMLVRRMNEGDKPKWTDPRQDNKPVVPHGFRSTFRDWAAEHTHFAREVAEIALAHISGDEVELSYRRSDLFDKRRQLMDAWARYCGTPSTKNKKNNKVVPINRQQRGVKHHA